ncbi:hypothetical protein [uncultured Nostoc sp.]|uniref:hypothetical protein n=1 Tax=uncultured Nostoc sp. TaxID=340711 RepID=UPI0035C965AB
MYKHVIITGGSSGIGKAIANWVSRAKSKIVGKKFLFTVWTLRLYGSINYFCTAQTQRKKQRFYKLPAVIRSNKIGIT